MLALRWRSDSQARAKKGAPAHSTTGVLRANCSQRATVPSAHSAWRQAGTRWAMARTKTGRVRSELQTKRRCMSCSSASSSPSSAGPKAGLRSRAMPHFGQAPGRSDSTPGHIGQKYFAVAEGRMAGSWW